ncbi:hypothetical protein SDC9_201697 [bioreactor metagenome]|uniref:Uncharacterized protein n=1 Tax=bioreactor metagenome TaxID=1076179 RepID=A0A645IRN2_9ZZZZ
MSFFIFQDIDAEVIDIDTLNLDPTMMHLDGKTIDCIVHLKCFYGMVGTDEEGNFVSDSFHCQEAFA